MNGVHDMGGMHGFGRIHVETDEPVFHARWEGRVFAMMLLATFRLGSNFDAARHRLECVDPVSYLTLGYYGRWLRALETFLRAGGVFVPGDLEARVAGSPAVPPARAVPFHLPAPGQVNSIRSVDRAPRFALGDEVRTRNHQPSGHTRLPGYVRCRRGVIVRVYPACVYPDTNAHGNGENPQFVYCVRFSGAELWGAAAEPGTAVHVDLFEPYLEAVDHDG